MKILDLIGNTPLINIGNIYIKMELLNPSGSIKDRIAYEMMKPYIFGLRKKLTIVEATSGNTGISIAMVCAVAGINCWILCPPDTSRKKVELMMAYGAKINHCSSIKQCTQKAMQMVKDKQADVFLNQFNNLANVEAQKRIGKEVAEYIKPDAIVAGTGTGGTLMGLHRAFPDADIYEIYTSSKEPIEGITDHVVQPLIPANLERKRIGVPFEKAKETAEYLAQKHGIACGYSSGANYYVAKLISGGYRKVLTVFPDNRLRYL